MKRSGEGASVSCRLRGVAVTRDGPRGRDATRGANEKRTGSGRGGLEVAHGSAGEVRGEELEELIRNGGGGYERNGKSNKEIWTSTERFVRRKTPLLLQK